MIVTTSQRSFTVLERLLDMLDSEIAPELREIKMIELEHASATRLARLIQEMMDARLERLREVQPETADLEKVTVQAEERTNRLVVAAGAESFEVIQQLAAELDTSTLADQSLVEVITVSATNIDRLAETINQIMERRYADVPDSVQRSQRPLVLTDPRTNSLLVAANPEDLTAIQGLVARLEEAPINPAVAVHVVPVPAGRAELVAPRLQRLMRERQQSLGDAETPADRVTIEPLESSNSLIVAANEENLQVVMQLLDALSRAEAELVGDASVEVIQLTQGRAEDVVDVLDELYVDEENRKRGENTIRVTADDRINALLVSAPEADVDVIRRLVADLDGARPSTVVEIKYIPLTSANALETVSLIENVLSGRGIGSRRGTRQSTVLKYLREIVGEDGEPGQELTEMQVSTAIRESIILTPDVRTNTVIVTAPRDSIGMIEQMIRDLDTSSVGLQSIRIFKLVNADASAMADILTELFNLERQGNLYVLKPRETAAAAVPGGPGLDNESLFGLGGPELTAVPDERQQLSITVDSRTNSLLVSGTPTYLDLVQQVVEELDAQEASERTVFLYPLRNADAERVADVIRDFVETEQQKLVETLSLDQIGSAARLLEREVTIVDDTSTNSVLVSVSPRYEQRIRDLIEELDVDPPQVLIQVLLAEITLDDSTEFGIDSFELDTGGPIVRGSIGSGVIGIRDLGLMGSFVSGVGVPNIGISSSDFALLIRALQAQGRVQVLSNPSVMAANNEPARIQVGETIRVPESILQSDTGSQSSSVVAEDTGIILSVTPTINPDGFVKM
ncbi:MAG: secretin N-terminal domain-containing protein, partial [Planctomycetota bacterium]